MEKPLLSVIVPVYNVEALLPRCVDSLLAQTYENLEIILVEDGTKDSSGRICDDYAVRDPRVKVIHKENGGLSSARNAGIDIAAGEYLTFVDSDDWIAPTAYENMLALAEKYSVKLVCAGRWDVYSDGSQTTVGLCPTREEVISGQELVSRIFRWDNVDSAAWDKLYHRSLFRQIRYPLGMICEDVPTTYRIALDAGQAAMYPQPIYYYYHRPGSITTAAVTDKSFHLCRHTARVYDHIRESHPELAEPARYLRAKSLMHILLTLETGEAEVRQKFAGEYADARSALGEHLRFILGCPWFGKQEKLTALLLEMGLYRPFRKIYKSIRS